MKSFLLMIGLLMGLQTVAFAGHGRSHHRGEDDVTRIQRLYRRSNAAFAEYCYYNPGNRDCRADYGFCSRFPQAEECRPAFDSRFPGQGGFGFCSQNPGNIACQY